MIKAIVCCLWGPLGIHFINFKPYMCIWGILGWWRLHAPTSASPSPPHMLLCLSLVHCIVTRAHGAGGLVCMLSLIIASGKTIFLCKIECIADCECCDNRQTGRSAHRHPPCPSRHWLSLWQLSLWSSFQTMQPIIMHGSHIQIPPRSLSIWERSRQDDSHIHWITSVFFWLELKLCFLNGL